MISEHNSKATKLGICVHLCNISFFFGCKDIWINTKATRKMYFSVKRLILNAWKTFSRFLKVIFTFLLFQAGKNWVSKRNKCKNGLWSSQDSLESLNKRCFVGIFFIFLFIIRHKFSLFLTRKMIFYHQSQWTLKIRFLYCYMKVKKRIIEQNRKKNVFLISVNIWKATKWGICVHTINISFLLSANWYESTQK